MLPHLRSYDSFFSTNSVSIDRCRFNARAPKPVLFVRACMLGLADCRWGDAGERAERQPDAGRGEGILTHRRLNCNKKD